MNLIPKICEMLGVEVGEEFKLENVFHVIYKFQGTGLFEKTNTEDSYWRVCNNLTLRDILTGIAKIEKLPFEPKDGDLYWGVGWVGLNENVFVGTCVWHDTQENYADKYCGNCFRTEAEAEKHKYEIYEKLTGKKWKEKCDT